MGRNIIVAEPLSQEKLGALTEEAERLGFSVLYKPGSAAENLEDAEIFFGIYDPGVAVPDNLKWICLPTAGVNGYTTIERIKSGDCLLSCSSGAYGVTISEHIIMMILMLMRRIPEYLEDLRHDIWRNDRRLRSIYGSRITVLGTGDIGNTTAARLQAFEPECITGISKTGIRKSCCYNEVLPVTELDSVLSKTDLLIMALPETEETVGIIGSRQIDLLRDGAMLINVGRGSAIDEESLIKALESGKLAGAALDVIRHEPVTKDDPLLSAPNLLLTPHMAGQRTLERTVCRVLDMFTEDLKHYAAGEPLVHRVNPYRGY